MASYHEVPLYPYHMNINLLFVYENSVIFLVMFMTANGYNLRICLTQFQIPTQNFVSVHESALEKSENLA